MSFFNCVSIAETSLTNRLYIGLDQEKSDIYQAVFQNGKERKGLGVKEYPDHIGKIFASLGIAFISEDQDGNTLYVDKRSFCRLLDRLQKNNLHFNYFDAAFVENEYQSSKNVSNFIKTEKILAVFNKVFPSLSDKNIAGVAIEMLGHI